MVVMDRDTDQVMVRDTEAVMDQDTVRDTEAATDQDTVRTAATAPIALIFILLTITVPIITRILTIHLTTTTMVATCTSAIRPTPGPITASALLVATVLAMRVVPIITTALRVAPTAGT